MSQFALLGRRRFLPLFVTQFLGAINDNIFKNALVIYFTFALADAMGIDGRYLVVAAGGIFILPFFLFSAVAGQIADHYEKSALIRYIKIAEIFVMSLGAAGFLLQNVYVLLVVLFLMGTQSTFFGPLKYGILPAHLPEKDLTGANGMVQMGTYIAILGGTIIGGLLIAMEKTGPLLVSAAVLLVAASGWLASRQIPIAKPADIEMSVSFNIARETWRIMRYAVADSGVFPLICGISWFWFLGATFLSLIPTFVKVDLYGAAHVVTILLTAFSVGIGTGSLLCERFSRGGIELGLIPIGAVGISICAVDIGMLSLASFDAAPETLYSAAQFMTLSGSSRILLDLALIGGFGGILVVPLYAAVQARVASAHCARVIAAINIVDSLLMVVSAAYTSLLFATGFSVQQIFLLTGGANLICLLFLMIVHREFAQRLTVLLRLRSAE